MYRPERKKRRAVLALVVALLPISISSAHHSGAQYDRSTIVEKQATVIRFDFRNPHAYIYVSDADGVEWTVEMNSAVRLRRDGWSAESLKAATRLPFGQSPTRTRTRNASVRAT